MKSHVDSVAAEIQKLVFELAALASNTRKAIRSLGLAPSVVCNIRHQWYIISFTILVCNIIRHWYVIFLPWVIPYYLKPCHELLLTYTA